MSTVEDLLLWDRNFYKNRLGKGTLVQELQTPGVLNNGNKISYAMGLDLGNYRGLPIVDHSGALFGYRTELLRFPEQKFSVICLCNVSDAVPENLARRLPTSIWRTSCSPKRAPSTRCAMGISPIPPASRASTEIPGLT